MTEREAFEAWAIDAKLAFRNQHGLWFYRGGGDGVWPAWQAACAWQRGRDAQVCEASGYADAAADAIRAQGKQ